MPAGTGITITNLLGSQTQSGNMTVTAVAGAESVWGQAQWKQPTGSLELKVAPGQKLPRNTLHIVTFTIMNPAEAQGARAASILSMEAPHLVEAVALDTSSAAQLVLPLAGAQAGLAVPLLVKQRGFAVATMAQSTCFPGSLNTITLSLAVNSMVQFGARTIARIEITGLHGADITGEMVDISQAQPVFESLARWRNASHLTLAVAAGKSIAAGQVLVVSLQSRNPWAAQEAPKHVAMTAVLDDDSVAYSSEVIFDDTPLPFAGSVAGDAHAFRVCPPGFTWAQVDQESPYGSYLNTIRISFAMSANLSASEGSYITIHGLTGNTMLDSQTLLIAGGFVDTLGSTQQAPLSETTDFAAGLLNDVWQSNANASQWHQLNKTQPWMVREGHALLYDAGASGVSGSASQLLSSQSRQSSSAIYLIGGRSVLVGRNRYLNDVWRSDNGGLDWVELDNSTAFPARAWFGASVLNGLIYVSGGVTDPMTPLRDLYYSSTGADWVAVSAMPWRGHYASVLMSPRLLSYALGQPVTPSTIRSTRPLYTSTHASLTIMGGINCFPGCNNVDLTITECQTLAATRPPPACCAGSGDCVYFNVSQLVWSWDGITDSWQVTDSSTEWQRLFANSATSSDGTMFVAGGLESFDRFYGSMYKSSDGGRTWSDVTDPGSASPSSNDKALPSEAFHSAMGQMEELNGCMYVVGGYTRFGSTFVYLDSVWASVP